MCLLKAEHITKKYSGRTIIKDINIELNQGELVSLLGVSGSGKTTLFHVLSGLTTPEEGKVFLNGEDITSKPGQISYMLQKDLLFPHKKIIDNTALPLVLHGMKKKEAIEKAQMYFKDFGLEGTEYQYPSQLSGGMRQRVVIAIAVACRPKILICDEPTTALDVTIQAQILQLLKELRAKYHLTIVMITHDLGVVANIADRVAVMYAGDIVEIGTADEIYYDPRHPYTWALLSSMPQMGIKGEDLFNIVGTPPNLFAEIRGDAFAPRNPQALKIDYVKRPPYFEVSPTHKAKTWLLDPRAPHIEPPAAVKKLQKEGL